VSRMERSTKRSDQPASLLQHEVVNQLTVIVGNCDLMKPELREGSEAAKRLSLIREAAIRAVSIVAPRDSAVATPFLPNTGSSRPVDNRVDTASPLEASRLNPPVCGKSIELA
jgi:hypothetical protein